MGAMRRRWRRWREARASRMRTCYGNSGFCRVGRARAHSPASASILASRAGAMKKPTSFRRASISGLTATNCPARLASQQNA